MANPNPNTIGLRPNPKIAPEGTFKRPVQVKVPVNQYEAWMSLPAKERNDYLREAISKKLIEKNLL